MVENARYKFLLTVLVTIVLAGVFVVFGVPLGHDLKGGTRLVYQVDFEAAKARGEVKASDTPRQVLEDMIIVIRNRVDPTGVLDVLIAPQGEDRILIELPSTNEAEKLDMIRRITQLGRLEMKMVADDEYKSKEVSFDMKVEKERLEKWLRVPANRKAILEDPLSIRHFNAGAGQGGENGPLSPHLLWYPTHAERKEIEKDEGGKKVKKVVWEAQRAGQIGKDMVHLPEPDPEQPAFPAFAPLNNHEATFTGADLVPSAIRASTSDKGFPSVAYEIEPTRAPAYSDLSAKYIGKQKAIVLNGMIRVAPVFRSRIPGRGEIEMGAGSDAEVADLVKVLRTGSLRIKPELVSETTLGPGLGREAIDRGVLSLSIGGIGVVLFMLWYYKRAGLIAVVTLLHNLVLLLGLMAALRATLTLPGMAGLVLTIGMAVDANILIYERIREELERGKSTAQAVKAGFERAFLAILDGNVTTFLAGLILYNVGSGPVKGFAVTLMAGIATTLFSNVFLTKLLFHWLVEHVKVTGFPMKKLLATWNVRWMDHRKPLIVFSSIATVAGFLLFVICPADTKYGLDFTGGAAMRVSLRKPLTQTELRDRLLADPQFRNDFPSPQITTTSPVDSDRRASQYSIKLKLSEAKQVEFEQQKKATLARGEAYEPPFVGHVRRILGKSDDPVLASEAFEVAATPVPSGAVTTVGLNVHFLTKVKKADLATKLSKYQPDVLDIKDHAKPGSEEETDYYVECDMPAALTSEDMVKAEFSTALTGLTDAAGNPIRLSTPFPEAEIIGTRASAELADTSIRALILALAMIVLYVRIRFHEYKYGIGAIVAQLHDLAMTIMFVVAFNWMGLVDVEVDLALIAVLLTIIGYSVNDTIVLFDRVRENLDINKKLGNTKESYEQVLNRSINETMSRTIWTSATVVVVTLCQFALNYGTGSPLEGFAFPLLVGFISGCYSTIFIAGPVTLAIHNLSEQKTRNLAHAPKQAAGAAGSAPS